MGRHAAADGAGTDPIVAAALASQDNAGTGTRHATGDGPTSDATEGGTESGLGWPGDTTTGGGLGWPDSTDAAPGDDRDVLRETTRMDAVPAVPDPREAPGDDAEPVTRRGWRRLFGGTAA